MTRLSSPWSMLLLLLVVGCGASPTAAEPTVPAPTHEIRNANVNVELSVVGAGTYRVAFRDIVSTGGCFFFSGPTDLGRDDHLGESAVFDGETLRFDPRIVFTSTAPLNLMREARHDYSGVWISRETVVFAASGSGFVGRYHYDEIGPGETMPGTCHIDARIELWPWTP